MVLKKCFRTYGRTLVLVLNRMKLLETYETWKGAAYNHTCLDGIMMFFKRNVAGKGCFCGFFPWKTQGLRASCTLFLPTNSRNDWCCPDWLMNTIETHWNIIPHPLPFARRRLLPLALGRGMAGGFRSRAQTAAVQRNIRTSGYASDMLVRIDSKLSLVVVEALPATNIININ